VPQPAPSAPLAPVTTPADRTLATASQLQAVPSGDRATASLAPVPAPADKPKTAQENGKAARDAVAIAALIIQESRQSYYASGHPCACPDDVTRSGRRCGGNSAYSRPGGAAPLCYDSDVSAEMIARYRANAAPKALAQ
jgi:hypothetical protein